MPVVYVPSASNQTYSICEGSFGTGTPHPFARETDLEMEKSFRPPRMKLKISFLRVWGSTLSSSLSISRSSSAWYFDSLKK